VLSVPLHISLAVRTYNRDLRHEPGDWFALAMCFFQIILVFGSVLEGGHVSGRVPSGLKCGNLYRDRIEAHPFTKDPGKSVDLRFLVMFRVPPKAWRTIALAHCAGLISCMWLIALLRTFRAHFTHTRHTSHFFYQKGAHLRKHSAYFRPINRDPYDVLEVHQIK